MLTLARQAPRGVNIRLVRLPDDPDPSEAPGTHYRLEPTTLHLTSPAHLVIDSDSGSYPGRGTPRALVVMRDRSGIWTALTDSTAVFSGERSADSLRTRWLLSSRPRRPALSYGARAHTTHVDCTEADVRVIVAGLPRAGIYGKDWA